MSRDFEKDFFDKEHAVEGLQVMFEYNPNSFPGFSAAM